MIKFVNRQSVRIIGRISRHVLMTFLASVFYLTASHAQTLQDYLQLAAENNPGLQAQYKEFEAALEKVPQVKTLQDPTFSFGYFISPVETRVGPQRARFSLSQMFPWFGTLKAQGDAAAFMADARYQAFIEARNKLFFQVASAYYPLYELQRLQEIEQENTGILESYKNTATEQFENGNGAMADVLRVDIMLKDAVTNLKILTDKERSLAASFNALLNRPGDAIVMLPDTLRSDWLPEQFSKDSMLANSPVLKELNYRLSASAASETAAGKQGMPKVGVGLDYVIVDERNDMALPDNGKDVIMPMVSVSVPIFRSRYKAAAKEAQLMQESYALQKEASENALTADYESVVFEIRRQRDLLQLYEEQVQESEQILDLLFTTYSNSGEDFEEVLQMQQQLLNYERLKVSALVAYQVAVARLNYITGNDLLR